MEQTKVLVTSGPSVPDDNAVLVTKSDLPNVEVVRLTWYRQAGIRAVRTYAQGVAANLLTVAVAKAAVEAMGIVLPSNVFLAGLIAVILEPLRITAITFIQNSLELTSKSEGNNPKLRA